MTGKRKPNIRITYSVNGVPTYSEVNADSHCDIDHAIKRLKDNTIVAGHTFEYHSWYVLDKEE